MQPHELKQVRTSLGLTQDTLAQTLNVTRQTINRYEQKIVPIPTTVELALMQLSSSQIPLAGVVAAGEPIEPIPQMERVEVPKSMVGRGETFALRVKGTSMRDEGIFSGDVVVVQKQATVRNGQTVIALVNGEATIKTYYRKTGTIELHPANDSHAADRHSSRRTASRSKGLSSASSVTSESEASAVGTMDRQIVCFGIPAFEVAVARLHDPSLSTRPVAIAPLNTSRALLREVSAEAEQEGLAVGMSVDQARRVCPSLHVLSPNPSRVRTAEASLLHIVSRYAPVWEPVQPGSFVMDLTGTGRLFGPAYDVAAKVQQEVLAQYRLDGVAGVGSNKLVAQTAATLIQPSELYDVRPGSEPVFMAPLVGAHPAGPAATLHAADPDQAR